MTAQSLIFALFLLDILYSLVFSLDCLIIKRARVTLLPTHCIFYMCPSNALMFAIATYNNYSQFIAPLFIEFLPADQIDMPHIYTNYCHF